MNADIPIVDTTTAVSTSQASVVYGTPLTLTATISANTGATAPGQGSVEFYSGAIDLGSGVFQGSSGASSAWTYTTTATQLQAGANQDVHAIYTSATGFNNSSGTLSGGQTVTRADAVIHVTPYTTAMPRRDSPIARASSSGAKRLSTQAS